MKEGCRKCENIKWGLEGFDEDGRPLEYGKCDCGATYVRRVPTADQEPGQVWFCFRCRYKLPTESLSDEKITKGDAYLECPYCKAENLVEWTGASDSVGISDSSIGVNTHY